MTDLDNAKNNLNGYTICLCKEGNCIFSVKKGIAPMMGFIAEGIDLTGYSVADLVVGKAAALLFVKCGIISVYARTLSESGKRILELYGIDYECKTLTDKIINRAGTDICPMEKAVANTDNAEVAYDLLAMKLKCMETLKK